MPTTQTPALTERALYDLGLVAIQERCGSFALDDEDDQRNAAREIAAHLDAHGVQP